MPARSRAVQKSQTSKILIAGEEWRLVFKSLRRRKLCGLCDYDTRTITVCTSVKGIDELDTLIHECLHACQGFASEEHVAEVATTVAEILWNLGYRKEMNDGIA